MPCRLSAACSTSASIQFEKQKKEREARKAQKIIEIKEIRLRPRTGEHDLDTKVRQALSFLDEGSKVKVTVRFRGREITHPEIARDQLEEFAKKVGTAAVIEAHAPAGRQKPVYDARSQPCEQEAARTPAE